MALDPAVAAQVAHLFDATLAQVLSGEVAGRPVGPPLRRADVEATDASVPGPGGPVRVRTYRPRAVAGPLPALVWAHGGGWRYGDLAMPEADSVAQEVAARWPGAVVSVDYRLAPAHTHPAGLDDVVAAASWAQREASAVGLDPARIVVGGASAGAHLACLAALALAGAGTPPRALWLAYPVTDPSGGPWGERHADCPPVIWTDRDATCGMFAAYLGTGPEALDAPDGPGADPALVPARADLSVLPPTLVTTAECDGLEPQGRRFVDLLAAAGVDVAHHHVEGVLHGYLNTLGGERIADEALTRHLGWLADVAAGS